MTEQSPSAWLASIAEVFAEADVDWTLVGALAANHYRATTRFTTDVDVLADFDGALIKLFQARGYEVEVVADTDEPPHLLRCRRGAVEKVDVLLTSVDYQRHALRRSVDHVLAVEDVIIHKLIAWRLRDRDDIRSILEAGAVLDDEYLSHWVDAWELGERWQTFAP